MFSKEDFIKLVNWQSNSNGGGGSGSSTTTETPAPAPYEHDDAGEDLTIQTGLQGDDYNWHRDEVGGVNSH